MQGLCEEGLSGLCSELPGPFAAAQESEPCHGPNSCCLFAFPLIVGIKFTF